MSLSKNNPQLQQAFNDSLSRIRARFVNELQDRVVRLDELKEHLAKIPTDRIALNEVGQIAHKIAGTAATLGFPNLGSLATETEDYIHRFAETGMPPYHDVRAKVDAFYDCVRDVGASVPARDENS